MTIQLTQDEIDALRSAIPARTLELTRAIARERDQQLLAHLRGERDALESSIKKLAAA